MYDLIIRDGLVVDGQGGEPFHADVAVRNGLISAIGSNLGAAKEEIGAKGMIVTPGFVDIHTHYDGQATWEQHMAPSSGHGVSTVVMGNCGVGFAPCRRDQHDMLVRLMEGVEDIPEPVMTAGVPWDWETFPEYLDALAERELDIDVGAQLPHSAVRVFVMGERGANHEAPTDDDLSQMRALTAEALRAGALGVSTSRAILLHREKGGRAAPSCGTELRELKALASGLRDAGGGVFQMIPDHVAAAAGEFEFVRAVAETSGRPVSFTLLQVPGNEHAWRDFLGYVDQANREGLIIKGQVYPRSPGTLYGLDLSTHPFSLNPSYKEVADLPLAEKVAAMRNPEFRARLLAEEPVSDNPFLLMHAKRAAGVYELGDPPNYEPDPAMSIGEQAARLGVTPRELLYDKLLEREGRAILYVPQANYVDKNLDAAFELMSSEHTVLGLGDGGAHYGMICDAAYPTYLLTRWVRDAKPEQSIPLSRAIQMLSRKTAEAVGLFDRGLLVVGQKADINVIDLDRMKLYAPSPTYDLPAGGRRLSQKADGYKASVVSGVVTYREGVSTGRYPGRLVRGSAWQTAVAAAS
jgi:N-acyl-D-aspartate/D-glutamate deacylase